MFKILTVAAMIAVATPAFAGGPHHGGGGWHGGGGGFHGGGGGFHHDGGGGWMAPFVGGAIVGGVLGGALYPYAPYYATPQPYYVPTPMQPYWDCDPYGQCAWVWR